MHRLLDNLAPSDWIGVLYRSVIAVVLIAGANVIFLMNYAMPAEPDLSFSVFQAVFVGGPFVVVCFMATFYQKKLLQRLSLLSRKDGLTGLNNRRTFMDHASQRLARIGHGVLLLLDADHFKNINDTYGHAVGDHCLEEIAHRLKWNLRKNDVEGRIGGEEFAIFLSGATIEQARVIAGRIGQPITYRIADTGECRTLTLSIGAVQVTPDQTLHMLLSRADDALYHAKRTGRAKTVVWQSGMATPEEAAQSVA